jgi:hypothetical protein
VTGGRPSSFQGVKEWGTPWPGPHKLGEEKVSHATAEHAVALMKLIPGSEGREQRRGEASPPRCFGGLDPFLNALK